MQNKKNTLNVPSQPLNLKSSNLMQPLLNISKASTPVRTRVVGNGSQPNSTPINFNKMMKPEIKTRSPIAKQNERQEGGGINLGPVLQLNRKLNEKTANYETTKNEYQLNQSKNYENTSNKQYDTISSNKSSKMLSVANVNLRGSNSFKDLIQARCKTPTRNEQPKPVKQQSSQAKYSIFAKKDSSPIAKNMKGSLSNNSCMLFGSKNQQMKCMNNDGRRAKYRVMNNEEGMVFCSKCTSALVHQGFIVEELINNNNNREPDSPLSPSPLTSNPYLPELNNQKQYMQSILQNYNNTYKREQQQLDYYYNTITSVIEQDRQKHKTMIYQKYLHIKRQPESVLKNIEGFMERRWGQGQVEEFIGGLDLRFEEYNYQQVGLEEKIAHFSSDFKCNHSFSAQLQNEPRHQHQNQSRNNPLRFSFQKLLTEKHNNNVKKPRMRVESVMRPLEQEEQEDTQLLIEPSKPAIIEQNAFRSLFSDEDDLEMTGNDIYSPTFKQF